MKGNKVKEILEIYLKKKNFTKTWAPDISKNLKLIEGSHKLILNPSTDVLFSLKVDPSYCNILGVMHGGAIATLIDTTTTLAVSGLDRTYRQNVSVELSTYYQNPVKMDSTILIINKATKIGRRISYSTGDIYDENFKLLSNSNHVKAMLEDTWL